MVDYAKLLDEEKARKDSALANAEAQRRREIELLLFFRNVEIALGQEMMKANQELKRRGGPLIEGPFRPFKGEEQINPTAVKGSLAKRFDIGYVEGLSEKDIEVKKGGEGWQMTTELVLTRPRDGIVAA